MGVAGVILGLLAIVGAFFVTLMFGTVGGIVTGVIAALAIVLGFLKRKKDQKGGIPAIVIGALALIMTIVMTGRWSSMFSEVHKKAMEYKPDGLWAAATEKTNSGLAGIISQLPEDEAGISALIDEMNELSEIDGTQE